MYTIAARICLILVVLIYFLVGSFLYFDPTRIGLIGLEFGSAETYTAIRVWGSFFYAVGILGCFGVFSKRWLLESLVAVTIVCWCVVTARLTGIMIDGIDPRQLTELRDESTGFAIALVGLACAVIGRHRPEG